MQNDKDFYIAEKLEVEVPRKDGTKLKFFAKEIGCLEMGEIMALARAGKRGYLAELIAASIEDAEGNKFTVDEATRLRKEVGDPLLKAAIKVNGLEEAAEKNALPPKKSGTN